MIAGANRDPPGLKPASIFVRLRGPKGPLFHQNTKPVPIRRVLRRGVHPYAASRLNAASPRLRFTSQDVRQQNNGEER